MAKCFVAYISCIKKNTSNDPAEDLDCALELIGCVRRGIFSIAAHTATPAAGDLSPAARKAAVVLARQVRLAASDATSIKAAVGRAALDTKLNSAIKRFVMENS